MKTRDELHLEFVKELKEQLDRTTVFKETKHPPIDQEINRLRTGQFAPGDLFKYKTRKGKVIAIVGNIVTARDIKNGQLFKVTTYDLRKF